MRGPVCLRPRGSKKLTVLIPIQTCLVLLYFVQSPQSTHRVYSLVFCKKLTLSVIRKLYIFIPCVDCLTRG